MLRVSCDMNLPRCLYFSQIWMQVSIVMIQDHFKFSCELFVTIMTKNMKWLIFNNIFNSVLYIYIYMG